MGEERNTTYEDRNQGLGTWDNIGSWPPNLRLELMTLNPAGYGCFLTGELSTRPCRSWVTQGSHSSFHFLLSSCRFMSLSPSMRNVTPSLWVISWLLVWLRDFSLSSVLAPYLYEKPGKIFSWLKGFFFLVQYHCSLRFSSHLRGWFMPFMPPLYILLRQP